MSREILLLVDALAREKAVEKEVVFTALELALASATKKRFQEDREQYIFGLYSSKAHWRGLCGIVGYHR